MRTLLTTAAVIAFSGQGASSQDDVNRPRLVTRLGHAGRVTSVAFSPDGRFVLTGSRDKTALLWDATSGREIRRFLGHEDWVEAAAISPDGQSVLTGSFDKTARLWDASSGKEIRRFEGHAAGVSSVAFSPDGRCILTGSGDNTARLWDTSTGKEIRRFEGHAAGVSSAAFSPDGRSVLTASSDKTARLWDTSSGKEIRRFEEHAGMLTSAAFSPDGRHILTGSCYETTAARLWDTSSGKEIRRFERHGDLENNYSMSSAFSPDGRCVLTGGPGYNTAVLWNVLSGKEVRRFEGHSGTVWSVAFSPDQRCVLTGSDDSTAGLWDASCGRELQRFEGHTDPQSSTGFSPDRRLVSGCSGKFTWLWDTFSGKETRRFRERAGFSSVAFSPDSQHVLTGSSSGIRLWDASSEELIRRFGEHEVTSAVFSPDGQSILSGSHDRIARIWDASSGKLVRRLPAHADSVSSVAFSPDGRFALTGSSDNTARLWDTTSGKGIRTFQGHTSSVSSVAFSPDGRHVLTGSWDRTARVWDASSGKETRRLSGHEGPVSSVAFSPDGRHALTGSWDSTARVWDASSGRELQRLKGHASYVSSLGFSPDGRHVITGSMDGTTRLWEVDSGSELCALVSFRGGSWAVVAPDGRFDASDLERIEGLHWVMPDDPMTPVPIEIFMRDYYEPRLLPRLLAGEKLPPMPPLVGLNRVQPRVRVASVEIRGDEATVAIEVEEAERTYGGATRRSGARDLQLFRDGRLVAHRDGPVAGGRFVFEGIALPRDRRKEVEFSAYAFNADGVKSATHRTTLALPPLEPRKGTAYVIALGIDTFADPKWNLSFAAADANAVAETLAGRLRGYARVVPVLLTGARARKGDLEAALRALAGKAAVPEPLARALPEDLVVISISTHGHTDAKGRFHLVPSDVAKGEGFLRSCISADELTEWLRDVDAGEMAMIVDACHSAASVDAEGFKPGPMGSRGLGQLAYSKRMRVLAASQASDVALESRVVRHGLLTYALAVDGLANGRADFDPKDGRVTLAEWFRYGERRVPSLVEEIAEDKVRGLHVERKRRVAQQPSLFDFAREADGVVLEGQ